MENEKSRPTILVDTEDKLEAFFNKDEIRLIEDVVDDALGFRDDYENIVFISVCSSNFFDDGVRITIGAVSEPTIFKVCRYGILKTEKLFKSIDRDFIFRIVPKLLAIDAIERKEV